MKSENVFKTVLTDHKYWKRQIECQDGCPVSTDARGYIQAIKDGDYDKAYLIARGPNPLASMCGRVCAAPCEDACRRGDVDKPLTIRALKRSASQLNTLPKDGVLSLIGNVKDAFATKECSDFNELGTIYSSISNGKIKKVKNKSIAIIGAGPAGLAAAHDLAILGFESVIYEKEEKPGGMLYYGVPGFRLPRDVIAEEIEVIKSLGVEIKLGVQIGKDITFAQLREKHDAVIVAVGARLSRFAPVADADGVDGILGGIDFLRDIACGQTVTLGEKVTVIGGGNVAYDVARSAVRHLPNGKGKVTILCLEPEGGMPADDEEVEEGHNENIDLFNSWGPMKVISKNGKITALVFRKVLSIFDEEGRFSPKYDDNNTKTVETDTLLWAIGQGFDVSFIDEEKDNVKFSFRKLPEADPETLQTSSPDVFLAGDLAHGARLMIDAIASGKKAARSVYGFVTGNKVKFDIKVTHTTLENYTKDLGFEKIPRHEIAMMNPAKRMDDIKEEIEYCYKSADAKNESIRCYNCSVNTIFDGNRCILCGGCADVCPELCLKLVDFSKVSIEEYPEFADLIKAKKGGDTFSAIIKDEEKCIRCGLCAERCPVTAITMEKFCFSENIST